MKEKLSEIIRRISSESDIDGDERVGYPCDGFANLVHEEFPEGEIKWTEDGRHCYIYYDGECFDETCPDGVATLESKSIREALMKEFDARTYI